MSNNNEQVYHELEQRYMTLHKDYENIYKENNLLKLKVTSLEDETLNLRNSLTTINFDSSKYESEIKLRDVKVRNLEYDVEKIREDYKRKCDECDRLRDDIKLQADQITSLQSRLREIQSISTENESKLLPLQYELNTYKREKELLENRNTFLESELEKKSTEYYQAKRDHLTAVQELELQLAQKNNENGENIDKVKQLEDHLSVLNEKVTQYIQQIQTLEENKNIQQNDFMKELNAQKKLTDLYKMNLDDSLKHIEHLEENITNITNSYREQVNSQKLKIQEINSFYEEKIQLIQNENNMKINELEKKLNDTIMNNQSKENTNTINSLGGGSSGGNQHSNEESTTSIYLPTEYELIGKGYTLTTMYSHLLQLEKDLNNEKIKKQELELYLDRILHDIENKAPMIASLRKDHMRLIESHNQLTKKLDLIINENNKLKKLNNKYENDNKNYLIETEKLNLINHDLCRQLQHLLQLQNFGMNEITIEKQQVYQQQINLLIQSSSSTTTSSSSNDIISEYLVTYDTIDELQKRNIQLLSIIRKLSSEQEEKLQQHQNHHSMDGSSSQLSISNAEDLQATLANTLNELEMMRESRQRMEDMVSSLIQQRDIYRAMLEDVDGITRSNKLQENNNEGTNTLVVTTPTRSTSSAAVSMSTNKQIEILQNKLQESEELLHKYQEKCIRLEHIEETLNTSLEKLQNECSTLRTQLIQSSSSSQYNQHRVISLETSINSLQNSYDILSKKKYEMDGILLSQQKSLQEKDTQLLELNDQMRLTIEQNRRLLIEKNLLKEHEEYLLKQINELKDEIKKSSQLNESMYRLETSITNNLTNHNHKLENEIDLLKLQLKQYEKNEIEYKLITEQKLSTLHDEMKLLLLNNQQKDQEIYQLKEDLLQKQNIILLSKERTQLLDQQSHLFQEFLHQTNTSMGSGSTSAGGTSSLNDQLINDNNEKDLIINKQSLEIIKLENEIKLLQETTIQYQQINLQTEKLFTEYQQKSNLIKESLENEKNNLINELNDIKQELLNKKQHIIEIRQEHEMVHEELQNKIKEILNKKNEIELELKQLNDINIINNKEINSLKEELLILQKMLNESNSNYERELVQHSNTIIKYKEIELNSQQLTIEYQDILNKLNDITLKSIEYEKLLESNKMNSERTIAELQEQVLNLKHTNDLLHNQIQIMSYEINKNIYQTISQITSPTSSASETTSGTGIEGVEQERVTTTIDKETGEIHGITSSSSSSQDTTTANINLLQQQLQQYRQTIHDLRDVIKHMKREKDMLDAKYTISEMEKQKYMNETIALNKSLDEIKMELNYELNLKNQKYSSASSTSASSASTSILSLKSEEEIQQLLADINQLIILRESNVHLRNENHEKSQLIQSLNQQIKHLQQELLPLNEKLFTLESNITIINNEKESLKVDCLYWKDRLHQLISRYNDIDPEEHRLLKEKLNKIEELYQESLIEIEKYQKMKNEIENKLLETENKYQSVMNELNSAKSTAETMEKTSENLRGKLREFNKQIQAQKNQINQLTSTSESYQQKINEQQNMIQKLQNDILIANSVVNNTTTTTGEIGTTAGVGTTLTPTTTTTTAPPPATTTPSTTSTTPSVTQTKSQPQQPSQVPAQVQSQTQQQKQVDTPVPSDNDIQASSAQESSTSTSQPQEKKSDLQSLREAAMRRMTASKKKPAEGEAEAPAPKKSRQTTPAASTPAVATPAVTASTPAVATPAVTTSTPPVAIPPPAATTTAAPTSTPVKCYYFSTPNGCRNGDSCRFSHVLDEPQVVQEKEELNEEQTQVSGTPATITDESPQCEIVEESPKDDSKDMEIVHEPINSEETEVSVIEPQEEKVEEETPVEAIHPVTSTSTPSITTTPVQPKPFGSTPFGLFSSFKNSTDSTGEQKKSPFANLHRQAPISSSSEAPATTTSEGGTSTPAIPQENTAAPFTPSAPRVFGSQFTTPTPSSTPTGFKGFGSSLFKPNTSTTSTFGRVTGGLFGSSTTTPVQSPAPVVSPASTNNDMKGDDKQQELPSEELSQQISPTEDDVQYEGVGYMEEVEDETNIEHHSESPSTKPNTGSSNTSTQVLPTTVTMTAEQRRLARFAKFKKDKPIGKKGKKSSTNNASQGSGEDDATQE